MDQFPEHIIEIIFSYLIDRKYYLKYDQKNFIVINWVRLVCRRFLKLEHYLVKNLILGMHWTGIVYQLYQDNHSFWKKNLSDVHHSTFWAIEIKTETVIDCSMLTHVKSLDIRWLIKFINYANLSQLKQLFCYIDHDVSELTKTNIHYHDQAFDINYQLMYDYGDSCQKYGCLIRHNNDPF